MATVQEIADETVELNRRMQFDEALERHSSHDLVSIEAMDGPMARAEGIEAVRKKGEWWAANTELHGMRVDGPYINGDQFAVRYQMDTTDKTTGQRRQGDEIGVYTVRDGKIVEERFMYGQMGGESSGG